MSDANAQNRTGCDFEVVVPTIGRPSLLGLLDALASQHPLLPRRIIVVDDRRSPDAPLMEGDLDAGFPGWAVVMPGRGRGPAAARNLGWRAGRAAWVVFLDDDVVPEPGWSLRLAADLAGLAPTVAGVEGRVRVPLPRHRALTDWERHVSGLRDARFTTADIAYRRAALVAAGGFDERFRRAYREDADLALRLRRAGWSIERGGRSVLHPVRPARPLISLHLQAGNADDVLMRRLHGRYWRRDAAAPPGRFHRHLAVVAAAGAMCVLSTLRRRAAAVVAGVAWLAGAAELIIARVAPGPRTRLEVGKMVVTSVPMPFWAVAWRALGCLGVARMRGAQACAPPGPR